MADLREEADISEMSVSVKNASSEVELAKTEAKAKGQNSDGPLNFWQKKIETGTWLVLHAAEVANEETGRRQQVPVSHKKRSRAKKKALLRQEALDLLLERLEQTESEAELVLLTSKYLRWVKQG